MLLVCLLSKQRVEAPAGRGMAPVKLCVPPCTLCPLRRDGASQQVLPQPVRRKRRVASSAGV